MGRTSLSGTDWFVGKERQRCLAEAWRFLYPIGCAVRPAFAVIGNFSD
jgi:hypothetical protein